MRRGTAEIISEYNRVYGLLIQAASTGRAKLTTQHTGQLQQYPEN